MQADSLFRLASMTKPVIAVAILSLFEEGKLLLTEPVSSYLPTFKGQQVAVPNTAPPGWAATELKAGGFHLEPALREITIKDLLTHTSGMGSATVGPGFEETAQVMASMQIGQSLANVIPRMGAVPLSFQPGTAGSTRRISASTRSGTSSSSFRAWASTTTSRNASSSPLGMRDTTFKVPRAELPRLAHVYERTPAGLRAATTGIRFLNMQTNPDNRYFSGGGGLVGTAEDYARFGMMLAGGGQLGDERVLSRRTVSLMGSNHIGGYLAGTIERATCAATALVWACGCWRIRHRQLPWPRQARSAGRGPSAPTAGSTRWNKWSA